MKCIQISAFKQDRFIDNPPFRITTENYNFTFIHLIHCSAHPSISDVSLCVSARKEESDHERRVAVRANGTIF